MTLHTRFLSLLTLMTLGSACGLGDAIEDVFDSPSTDGPFEIDVEVAEGMDPRLVRAGLFVDAMAEDEDSRPVDAAIDVLVSVHGKAKLINQPQGVDTVTFRPIALVNADADGALVVELPEVFGAAGGNFRLLVWYDADGDGALTLSDVDGQSEFARAPSRRFPESGNATMALFSVSTVDPEFRDERGHYIADAYGVVTEADGGERYVSNRIADRELTEWSVSLLEAWM